MADPYETLGVSKNATGEEIRRAYRKLAKEHHPDLNPGKAEAERRFKDISAAYTLLGDPEKRKAFDAGQIDETGAERQERRFYRDFAGTGEGFKYERHGGAGEFEDLSDLFGGLFRQRAAGEGGRAGTQFHMRGRDVTYTLPVDFLDAVNGAKKRVDMPDGKSLDITIPPGLQDGQTLRLKGQGMPGIGGGPAGDAMVDVQVRPHPLFQREGETIRSVVPITMKEALLGGSVQVPTISGTVDLKIPRRSNTGRILRLRGKGVPGRDRKRGDHMVELRIVLPDKPDAELEQFINEWEARHPYDPRAAKGARS